MYGRLRLSSRSAICRKRSFARLSDQRESGRPTVSVNHAGGRAPHVPPRLSSVTGDSTIGTADEAAAARDRRNLLRSAHIRSNSSCEKSRRVPVETSVAPTIARGVGCASRSA